MGNEKYLRLVTILSKRTREKTAPWQPTSREGVYAVSLPDYSVWMSLVRDDDGREDVRFEIVNAHGAVIDSFTDTSIASELNVAARSEFWKLAAELYRTARRQALGVDEALDKLIEQLGG